MDQSFDASAIRPDSGTEVMKFLRVEDLSYAPIFKKIFENCDVYPRTTEWIQKLLKAREGRTTKYLAIGPGTGTMTCLLDEAFQKGWGIEPNAAFHPELRSACPKMELVADFDSVPDQLDFVEYHHVAYYQTEEQIQHYVEAAVSKLAPGGVLNAILQDNDQCKTAVFAQKFTGRRYVLEKVMQRVARRLGLKLSKDIIHSTVRIQTEEDAYDVAVFMLSLAPFEPLPSKAAILEYIRQNFYDDTSSEFVFTNTNAAFVLCNELTTPGGPISVPQRASPEYAELFEVFSRYSHEKAAQEAASLAEALATKRGKYLAIGPGTGRVTRLVDAAFEEGWGIEPNETFHTQLHIECPKMKLVSGFDAVPDGLDFVEYHHVAYYQTEAEIRQYVEAAVAKLAPGGVLCAIIQDEHHSEQSALVRHFTGHGIGLSHIMRQVAERQGLDFRSGTLAPDTTVIQSEVDAMTFASFLICNYAFNKPIPSTTAFRQHVRERFWNPDTRSFEIRNVNAVYIITNVAAHAESSDNDGGKMQAYLDSWVARNEARTAPTLVTLGGVTVSVRPGVFCPEPSLSRAAGHLIEQLPFDMAGKRVLDLGCGSGLLAFVAACRDAATVVGVDLDPEAVANARENATRLRYGSRVEFRHGDLCAVVKPDEKFDIVLANLPIFDGFWEGRGMSVVETYKRFFEQLPTVCAPQGAKVWFSFASFGNTEGLARAMRESAAAGRFTWFRHKDWQHNCEWFTFEGVI